MKRAGTVIVAALMIALLGACGSGNTANGNAGNAGKADNHAGHGHGDEHGEAHELGEKKVGAYELHVSRVEHDSKTEGVFEIKVMKDGKSVKDAPVDVWVGDATGKELSPVAKGEWMDDEGLFDCHVTLPADTSGARLWVRLRPADTKLDAVDFPLSE
jgi:hypothetical protein